MKYCKLIGYGYEDGEGITYKVLDKYIYHFSLIRVKDYIVL